jgi:L-asparaginase / beta-aspartyl-peptidase
MRLVLAHGGTTSSPEERDGTRRAAEAGLAVLGQGPLEAVVEACRVLEEDERFHAGTGSTYRMDGQTIEMDAGVSCSDGRFGAVGAIERVRNPVLVARALADLPSNVLAGPAATRFARTLGMPDHDPGTAKARKEWQELVRKIEQGKAGPDENEWDEARLRRHWNYPVPFPEVFPRGFPEPRAPGLGAASDTVGAVATDGKAFAAAASTSGMTSALAGRLGDSVMLGCGILATEEGAVACSGNGDHILRARLATRVLLAVERGEGLEAAVQGAVDMFPERLDCAVVAVGRRGHAAHGNRSFAWSVAQG